jgi:RNA pseudouridylate synthase
MCTNIRYRNIVSVQQHTRSHKYHCFFRPKSIIVLKFINLSLLLLTSLVRKADAFHIFNPCLQTKQTWREKCSHVLERRCSTTKTDVGNTTGPMGYNIRSSIRSTTTTSTERNILRFPPVRILDQNEYYLVVEKPPSVVCHHSPWTGLRKRKQQQQRQRCVDDESMILEMSSRTILEGEEIPMLQRVAEQTGRRVNLVHRLDRGSSGCLLLTYADDYIIDNEVHVNGYDTNVDDVNKMNPSSVNQNNLPINSTRATAILSEALADKVSCTKTYVALVRGEGTLHGEDLTQRGWFLIGRLKTKMV